LKVPWDPVRDLLSMQERLESLFGRATAAWSPPVDLVELTDRYVVSVELPGLTREAVEIEYADGVLTVRGRQRDTGCCPERYQQLERGQGEFRRSFRFDRSVDAERISADLALGVLTISVPKAAVDLHRIEVK
jgi:HSP20 family protein